MFFMPIDVQVPELQQVQILANQQNRKHILANTIAKTSKKFCKLPKLLQVLAETTLNRLGHEFKIYLSMAAISLQTDGSDVQTLIS